MSSNASSENTHDKIKETFNLLKIVIDRLFELQKELDNLLQLMSQLEAQQQSGAIKGIGMTEAMIAITEAAETLITLTRLVEESMRKLLEAQERLNELQEKLNNLLQLLSQLEAQQQSGVIKGIGMTEATIESTEAAKTLIRLVQQSTRKLVEAMMGLDKNDITVITLD